MLTNLGFPVLVQRVHLGLADLDVGRSPLDGEVIGSQSHALTLRGDEQLSTLGVGETLALGSECALAGKAVYTESLLACQTESVNDVLQLLFLGAVEDRGVAFTGEHRGFVGRQPLLLEASENIHRHSAVGCSVLIQGFCISVCQFVFDLTDGDTIMLGYVLQDLGLLCRRQTVQILRVCSTGTSGLAPLGGDLLHLVAGRVHHLFDLGCGAFDGESHLVPIGSHIQPGPVQIRIQFVEGCVL